MFKQHVTPVLFGNCLSSRKHQTVSENYNREPYWRLTHNYRATPLVIAGMQVNNNILILSVYSFVIHSWANPCVGQFYTLIISTQIKYYTKLLAVASLNRLFAVNLNRFATLFFALRYAENLSMCGESTNKSADLKFLLIATF